MVRVTTDWWMIHHGLFTLKKHTNGNDHPSTIQRNSLDRWPSSKTGCVIMLSTNTGIPLEGSVDVTLPRVTFLEMGQSLNSSSKQAILLFPAHTRIHFHTHSRHHSSRF